MNEQELAQNKSAMRAWLFRLLSEVEQAEFVEGTCTEKGSTTILMITFRE